MARAAKHWENASDYPFAITRKSDGAFLGGCGLHPEEGQIEFGYWLGQPHWRMGYATEAVRRLVAYAFDELNAERVLAGWFHDNPRSGNVLAKLGCKPSAFEKRHCLARGMDIGCNIVLLTREAYAGRRAA